MGQTGKKGLRLIIIIILSLMLVVSVPVIVNWLFGNTSQFESFNSFINSIAYGSTLGLFFWLGNWGIGVLTGKKLDWTKNPARANVISLLSFISYGILVSWFIPYFFFKNVWDIPQERLISSTVGHAFTSISIDLLVISFYYSHYIVKYWGKTIKREEELKRENLIARYEALKNQVNPHFLFNTLNTLTGIVEQKPEKASGFIKKLSDIYRYVLEQKDKELIPISEELAFVDDFIYLSKMRYGSGLELVNQLNRVEGLIVPLGLQMLIENAIKHNIISDEKPLRIVLGARDGYLFISNNLQRKGTVGKSNQVGLENLIKRYEYLSNKAVLVTESEDVFEVKLPLLQN